MALVLMTSPGQEVVRSVALRQLAPLINGELRIGAVGGELWRYAEAREVVVLDSAGRPALRINRVRAGYSALDLLRGRIVVRGLTLTRPVIVLEQRADGSWNFQHLVRTDTAPGSEGPRGLLELRQARVVDGTVIVRRRVGRDSVDQRRIVGLTFELARLRLSHPDSGAITARLTSLAARMIEPAVSVVHAEADVRLDGDSVRFEVQRLRTAGSELSATGLLRWPEGRLSGAVDLYAARVALGELHQVDARAPDDGALEARARMLLTPDGGVSADLWDVELSSGRSSLQLSGRVTRSPRGAIAVRGLALDLEPLDLALLEPLAGPVPARGLVSGVVRATGSPRDLIVEVGASFADEGAAGRPVSSLTGRGRIGFASAPLVRDFTVARAVIALATARRFLPAIEQQGRIELTGRVAASRGGGSFAGRLAHVAPGSSGSELAGSASLALGDSSSVTVELEADSLRFGPLLRGIVPFDLLGGAGGRLTARGPLDSVAVELRLGGAWGTIRSTGLVRLRGGSIAARIAGGADTLNARSLVATWPDSRLTARWQADLNLDRASSSRPTGSVALTIAPSAVAGLVVRRAGVLAHVEPERLRLDSARVDLVGGAVTASGAVAYPGSPPRQISFQLRADTLAGFAPLVRWLARGAGEGAELRFDGSGRITGRFIGTASSWELLSTVELQHAGFRSYGVRGLRLGGLVARDSTGLTLDLSLAADSVGIGGPVYRTVQAQLAGRPDSLRASLAAELGEGVTVRGDGTYRASGAARSVALEALALDLVVGEWTLARPARLQLAGDSINVDSLELRGAGGGGRIVAAGTVASRGPGRMAVAGDSLALVDVLTLAGRDTTAISGMVSFAAAVEGEADDPRMELTLTLRDGRFRDYRAPDLQLFGSYADRRLDLKGGVWSGANRLVALSGTVPINLALRGADRRVLADSLLLVASADSLNMALLGPVVTVVRDLEGSAQFDVRVAGTWEQPRLTGFIEVSSGALTIPAVGVRYRDMDVRLELQDTTLRVMRGRLRASGTLELSGAVYFPRDGGLGRPRLDLAARADRFHAIEMRDFAGGRFSGDLTLRGPVLGAVVSGRVVANDGYLKFADLVEKRIVSLDDPEFRAIVDSNLARAAGLGPDVQTVFLDSLRIRDFQIAMGNDFWLRSGEANIQLAGEFVVNKTVEDGLPRYRMDGTLRTVRGTYRLVLTTISKEFRVTQGTIRFFGTPDFNPEMDVSAEHVVRTVEGGQLTVRVQIGGTLLAPRLRLESDQRPPLTETEIVSYLMFGQPTAALQAGAAGGVVNRQALVQSITATLTGYAAGELGSALISDLGLPLDYITIRPGAGTAGTLGLSSARIEAGTQIGSRTFLILDAGLCEVRSAQAVGATVEYRMGSRWTATAALEPVVSNCQVGTGTSSSADRARYQVGLDLFWSLGIR